MVRLLPRASRRQVAVLLALAALAGGCGGGGEIRGSSAADIGWLERLAAWQGSTSRAGQEVGRAYLAVLGGAGDRSEVVRALEPIRRCSSRLRQGVGPAPSPRFAAGFELLLRACEEYERAAEATARSFGADPGEALRLQDERLNSVDDLFLRAGREIEKRLTANKRLPQSSGVKERSRIEPLFSRVASALVGRDVEVVCWSAREWPKVVDEWGAYIGTRDIGAFAQYSTDRASLGPRICRGLVDLAYRGLRPAGGRARDEVARSVAVLAHESEHLANAAGSEAETECYGMQDIRKVARLLGATKAYASTLAELYWSDLYESNDAEYVSGECRDGGQLDRNPASATWP